jgi:hypothetical protein
MTTEKPNLADGNSPKEDKLLDSHVQGQPPVYGEPKGPIGGALFEGTAPRPPDRERDGFIGGSDTLTMGDKVDSGPEE